MDQRSYERISCETPKFPMPNRIVALALDVLATQAGVWWWLLKRVMHVLCDCPFDSRTHKHSVNDAQKVEIRQMYNYPHSVDTNLLFVQFGPSKNQNCPVNICFSTRCTPLEACLFRVALEFVSLVYLTRLAYVTLLMSLFACTREWAQMKEKQNKKIRIATIKPLFNVPKRLMIVSKWL